MAAALTFFAIGNLPSLNTNDQKDGTAAVAPERASSLDRKLTTTGEPVPTITSGRQHNRSSLQGSRSTGDTVAPPTTYGAASPDRQLSTETIPELQRLTDPVALQTCLDAIAVVLPGKATLIDYAYFEGKPALVISITTFGGRWMFVAGASCGINGPDELFRTPLK